MAKVYIVAIMLAVCAIAIGSLLDGNITGNSVAPQKTIISFPTQADLNTPNEGTIVFTIGFPPSSFKVGEQNADVLLFLNSQTITGLKVGYSTKEKKLYAGLPQIVSPELDLLDGNTHEIAYTFHKQQAKQALYIDGNMVASGEYSGEFSEDILTGFSVYGKKTIMESTLPLDISVSSKFTE